MNPPPLQYGHASPRTRRRNVLIVAIALAAVLLGYYGWKFIKPYVDQQRYLADERQWHAFFLPAGNVVQTNDPLLLPTLSPSGQWPDVNYDHSPSMPNPGGGTGAGPRAFMCLMRSPGGRECIVGVGTFTVLRYDAPVRWNVYFVGELRTPSNWRPGDRGTSAPVSDGMNNYILLKRADRLTIYAGVRAADFKSVTLPYRLNDQPGAFLVTLNDDGTVNIDVKSGKAQLLK